MHECTIYDQLPVMYIREFTLWVESFSYITIKAVQFVWKYIGTLTFGQHKCPGSFQLLPVLYKSSPDHVHIKLAVNLSDHGVNLTKNLWLFVI